MNAIRHEYRTHSTECSRDDGASHLAHRLPRRLDGFQPVGNVSFDVFDDNDRIIHHDTDGEHEDQRATARVQAEAEEHA